MMSSGEAIVAFCRTSQERLEALLEEVVNVNSHSGNLEGNRRMLMRFEALFRQAGLDGGGIVEGLEGRPHLVLHNREGAGPRVVLVGHTDTVFPIGHSFQRFERRGARAHGPGVSDMKGGLLVAYAAVGALAHARRLSSLRLTLFVNSDEEVQSPTSRHLLEGLCREGQEAAFVFEGGRKNGDVVIARKGVGKYVVRAHGKAAHAGINPADGVNAIVALAQKIPRISALSDHSRGVSVNAGLISGGISRNTVAPDAEVQFDVRVETEDDAARVDASIRDICAQEELRGARIDVEGGLGRPPWGKSAGSDRLLACLQRAAAVVGESLAGQATGGGSDGNFTHAAGVPTIDALGPVGGNPHTSDEYIEIESLSTRAAIVALALAEIGAVGEV